MFPLQLRRLGERLGHRIPMVAVGIDIGRSAIRVAALRRSPRGIELAGLASAPLAVDRPIGSETALVRDAVRRACRHTAYWPRRVAVAVAAGGVLARTVQVADTADDEEVTEAVERAARQLPVPTADLRVAWARPESASFTPAEEALPRPVLMVAARREAVLARQRLAARAGLGLVLVDVDVFAGLRAMGVAPPGVEASDPGRLLVDAGSDSVRIVVSAAGGLPLFRVVPLPQPCPLSDLAGAISEALRGLVPDGVAAPPVLVLSGGRVAVEGAARAVNERTGLPCRLAEPFLGLLDEHGLGLMPEVTAAVWPCAVGLARRALA